MPKFELLPEDPIKPGMSPNEAADLTSATSRFKRGLSNSMDGAVQTLMHALPRGVVDKINSMADTVGGEGTLLGNLGIKGMTPEMMDQRLANESLRYNQAIQINDPGIDLAGMAGEALSPHNLSLSALGGKILQGGHKLAKFTLLGAGTGALQPVTSTNDYSGDKTNQVITGGLSGVALGTLADKASNILGNYLSSRIVSRTPTNSNTVSSDVKDILSKAGIDFNSLPESSRFELTNDITRAIKNRENINPVELLRKYDFDRFGIEPTRSQITRDPVQFRMEKTLQGAPGVGEPLLNRAAEQQQSIRQIFEQKVHGAVEPHEAGKNLIQDLIGFDKKKAQEVRSAYDAFKSSTGKSLDVNTPGLAYDFATISRDFPLPDLVRRRFEEFGLSGGKQVKNMTMDDAEQLIKVINRNYNPVNLPERKGLNELRKAVEKSIGESVSDSSMANTASQLAKTARNTASERFGLFKDVPALNAAVNKNAAPDDFVKKYVINGSVDELNHLGKIVSPETHEQMKKQFMRHLQNKAFGADASGDSSIRQAFFNNELKSVGSAKLNALLGKEEAEDLLALGRVMANIQNRPSGSAGVDPSTAQAVAAALAKAVPNIHGAGYIKALISSPIKNVRDQLRVQNALMPGLTKSKSAPDPRVMRALSKLTGAAPVVGAEAASD